MSDQSALEFGHKLAIPLGARHNVQRIYIHFENREAIAAFAKLVKQHVSTEVRAICYPPGDVRTVLNGYRIDDGEEIVEPIGIEQPDFWSTGPWWERYWQGMPEFDQRDLAPFHSVEVFLRSDFDRRLFENVVGQTITPHGKRTRSIWFPEAEIGRFADKRYVGTGLVPRFPVYIISKGRWESRLTSKSFERLGVPYRIVVEPQEFDQYAAVIDPSKILVLPFSNLGQGSIPARNWVWEHAIASGAERHWIVDDNIDGFYRLNRNLKTPVADGTIFYCMEEFATRYENVALAGPNYFMFASRKTCVPPFVPNTRIYSCILIKNDLPYRWRGRYNEDTDLSLRALKDGWATILFGAFLQFKSTTMTMKGGNTDELYKDDGRLKMAESLRDQHPDVTTIARKWGRWQHQVDYSGFRTNRLKARADVTFKDGIDDFGMTLQIDGEEK